MEFWKSWEYAISFRNQRWRRCDSFSAEELELHPKQAVFDFLWVPIEEVSFRPTVAVIIADYSSCSLATISLWLREQYSAFWLSSSQSVTTCRLGIFGHQDFRKVQKVISPNLLHVLPVKRHFLSKMRLFPWSLLLSLPLGGRADNIFTPRIVGGTQVTTPFPFYVHAFQTFMCGGSLITPDMVLSAAHCFPGYNMTQVAVNATRFFNNVPKYRVAEVFPHPDYNKPRRREENDIMLVRLERQVPNAELLRLNFDADLNLTDAMGTTMGFGQISDPGPTSDKLLQVDVPVVDEDECRERWQRRGVPSPFHLCAGAEGKDTCGGDSGGPLLLDTDEGWLQIGVTSFGIGCGAERPGIYSRVSFYTEWIQETVCKHSQSTLPEYCTSESPSMKPTTEPVTPVMASSTSPSTTPTLTTASSSPSTTPSSFPVVTSSTSPSARPSLSPGSEPTSLPSLLESGSPSEVPSRVESNTPSSILGTTTNAPIRPTIPPKKVIPRDSKDDTAKLFGEISSNLERGNLDRRLRRGKVMLGKWKSFEMGIV